MYTIIETTRFSKMVNKIWSADEYDSFLEYIAQNPLAGDVIPNTQGVRKVRWQAQGKGKSGGVRVIYLNFLADGVILLIAIYSKSRQDNISVLQIKEDIKND